MVGLSNMWYAVLLLLPIAGGLGIIFVPFKKRLHMCIYTETVVVLTSLLAVVLMVGRPDAALEVATFAGRFRISFDFDGMGTIFGGLISFLWPLATLYAFEYMEHEVSANSCKETTFFGFYTITYGVTLGIASATNLLTMYVCYEMLTLVTVPLIMFALSREATLASRVYLYYSLGGAAFGFITVVFLSRYGNYMDFKLGGILPFSPGDTSIMVDTDSLLGLSKEVSANLLRLVYLFGFFGFGVKAAVFPLCSWLPKAGVAPTPVTALLHAVAVVKSGAFAILRITYYGFGTTLLEGTFAQYIPMAFAVFTIAYGCLMAIRERHLKRRLAYSTVANLSYVLFGAVLMTPLGMTGSILHMVFHGIIKIAAFFCAGAIITKSGKEYIFEVDGMAHAMPITFITFLFSSLAIMGVPGLCGFVSKWYLCSAAAGTGNVLAYLGIGALMLSALFTAIYMMQIVIRAYFPGRDFSPATVARYKDPGPCMIIPFVCFCVCMLILGLFPGWLINLISNVAAGVF